MTGVVAREILQQINDLPPFPDVILELMNTLRQPSVDYMRLEQLISRDPALTGRVLRLANSSFFGLRNSVGSVHEACLVLGASTINHMVMAIAIKMQFPAEESRVLDRKLLWQHALGTAVTAGVLAKRVGMGVEQAFTAGLLHDLGKLALDAYFAESYIAVNEYKNNNDTTLEEAELQELGVTHREVGAWLAQHWRFPEVLIHVIRNHGAPDNGKPDNTNDLVHVADIVSLAMGLGYSGNSRLPVLSEAAWSRLGLDWDLLQESMPEIEQQAAEDPF